MKFKAYNWGVCGIQRKDKQTYLRLPTNVNMVGSILHTGFDHWLTIESVLQTHRDTQVLNAGAGLMTNWCILSCQCQSHNPSHCDRCAALGSTFALLVCQNKVWLIASSSRWNQIDYVFDFTVKAEMRVMPKQHLTSFWSKHQAGRVLL